MGAKLVAEEGILKGLVLSLEHGDQWVIGRDPDACQLLVEDPSASRKHLVCRTTPKGILLENLSDTNPVEVNKQEVKEPRLLHNGDAVKIGDGIFRFYAEDAAHLFKDDENNEQESDNEKEQENGEIAVSEIEDIGDKKEDESNETPKSDENHEIEEKSENNELHSSLIEANPSGPSSSPAAEESITPPPNTPDNKEMIETDKKLFPTTLQPKSATHNVDQNNQKNDSIFDEEPSDKHNFAEIDFGLLDTGRWLLKVINGPNNGAEVSMQAGNTYIIGTDPNACDVVFHDTSVSRQHTRITVTPDDTLFIEDLKSRNGTLVDGERLHEKSPLPSNALVVIGTTSFVVFDREGEMQTIISPLMPSIVKTLQEETPKKEATETVPAPEIATKESLQKAPETEPQHHTNLGAFILIGIIAGLFAIVGIGTSTLFKSEPIAIEQTIDPIKTLNTALEAFPSVKYTFNPSTGQLLLVGHVLTTTDKNQLLYALYGLTFIKSLDDSGVIIDEYVWREINQVLEKSPDWKGISVMANSPGHFMVSGYLQTRAQADRLSEYLGSNFPYPDLLEKRLVVDQELLASINTILQSKGLKSVVAKLDRGEVTLTGPVPVNQVGNMVAIVAEIKDVRGVRSVKNSTTGQAADQSVINISDRYEVTGISNLKGNLSVVINGRILMKGDILDGMTITQISPNVVYLQKEGTKYRIDFNR